MRPLSGVFGVVLGVWLVAGGWAGCASPRGRPLSPADLGRTREASRRAIYEAVLESYRRPDVRLFVADPELNPGHRTELGIEPPGVWPDTAADFAVQPAGTLPRDLDVGLPVVWLGEPAFHALARDDPTSSSCQPRWDAFHRRFPGSAGHMQLSNVGLSRDGRQALVGVWIVWASLGGEGHFVVLRRVGTRWQVVDKLLHSMA